MKIRIKDNSVRFRLTQNEVSKLNENKQIESLLNFGNTSFKYSITSSDNKEEVILMPSAILAFINNDTLINWANSDQVGIYFQQKVSQEDFIKVSIEKDFKCLVERAAEDDSDSFPNPNAQ